MAINMKTAINRYNDIMVCLGYEHNTIGTPYSESTDGWNLRDMVSEAQYVLDCYYEGGHVNCEMRYSDDTKERQMWRNETARLRRFIKRYEDYIEDMECVSGHCSMWD